MSRIVLVLELAVVAAMTLGLGGATAFGILGIYDLRTFALLVASAVVLMAFMATIDTGRKYVFYRHSEWTEDLHRNGAIALAGALIASSLTIYARLELSETDRWVQGFDFLALGCFLWVPLVHLGVLSRIDASAN